MKRYFKKLYTTLKIIFKNPAKTITIESCILCQHKKIIPLEPVFNDPKTIISICEVCGLMKLHPMPSNNFYKTYYEKKYIKVNKIPKSSKKASRRGLYIKKFVIEYLSIIKGVFEIGCAGGDNLLAFKSLNPSINLGGIDPSELSVNVANESGLQVYKGFNKDITESLISNYDLIILSHILEHFINPYEELLYLSKIINKNSLIYLEVPDLEKPNIKLDLYSYWFKISHTHYFTEFTLKLICKKCNLEILKFEKNDGLLRVLVLKNKDENDNLFNVKNIKNGIYQLLLIKNTVFKSFLYKIIKKIRQKIFLTKRK